MLPTLDKLHQRNPQIYPSANCVICKVDVVEDLDHLFSCEAYKEIWIEIEKQALALAWAILEEETRFEYTIRDLKDVVFGNSREIVIEKRKMLMQGLVS